MTGDVYEACLVSEIGSERKVFPLREGAVCRIGRGDDNTIVIDDNQVSRRHAIVQCTQPGEFYLTDLGSRNGTFLNHRRVTAPVLLQTGDRITVGSLEFEFNGMASRRSGKTGTGETMLDVSLQMITLLVADIRDFTGLSRRLGDLRLSETMSTFFRECGKVLNEQGAWGQKYIGDAVMAFWIHRGRPPDAWEMVGVLTALTKVFEVTAGLQARLGLDCPVRIGAGVNTGRAFVGNIGSATASDYTALSDAVNLTFRLESATKEIGCDVVLGQETWQFLSEHADLSGLFEARLALLKGYDTPMPVYAGALSSVATALEILRRKFPDSPSDPATVRIDFKAGG